jgi:hypothetical protein
MGANSPTCKKCGAHFTEKFVKQSGLSSNNQHKLIQFGFFGVGALFFFLFFGKYIFGTPTSVTTAPKQASSKPTSASSPAKRAKSPTFQGTIEVTLIDPFVRQTLTATGPSKILCEIPAGTRLMALSTFQDESSKLFGAKILNSDLSRNFCPKWLSPENKLWSDSSIVNIAPPKR